MPEKRKYGRKDNVSAGGETSAGKTSLPLPRRASPSRRRPRGQRRQRGTELSSAPLPVCARPRNEPARRTPRAETGFIRAAGGYRAWCA